jgi:hypothetical protein
LQVALSNLFGFGPASRKMGAFYGNLRALIGLTYCGL